MNGTVIRCFPNKGYAFIRGEDGYTRFLHATQVFPQQDFDTIHEGQGVEFEPDDDKRLNRGNGLRAKNARLSK